MTGILEGDGTGQNPVPGKNIFKIPSVICSMLSKHQIMYRYVEVNLDLLLLLPLCVEINQWQKMAKVFCVSELLKKNVMVKSLVVDLAIVWSSRI